MKRRLMLAAGGAAATAAGAFASASSMCENLHHVTVLKDTPLTRSLQTLMRDKTAPRSQFVIASNRLTHLLIEEAMALLPSKAVLVETPCGPYEGMRLPAPNGPRFSPGPGQSGRAVGKSSSRGALDSEN
jgi:hypothetical protein